MLSVPLESTGDGSICCGYGLAGGAKESAGGPEDLYYNQHCKLLRLVSIAAYRLLVVFPFPFPLVVNWFWKRAGELGESE